MLRPPQTEISLRLNGFSGPYWTFRYGDFYRTESWGVLYLRPVWHVNDMRLQTVDRSEKSQYVPKIHVNGPSVPNQLAGCTLRE